MVTLEIDSTFYRNDYGNCNFIGDSQPDRYIVHVNESIQFCIICGKTLHIKADSFDNRKTNYSNAHICNEQG